MKTNIQYLIISAVSFVTIGCGAHSRHSVFMSQWSNAVFIHPDYTGKKWNEEFNLSDNVTAVMNAQSGIFGFVKIKYSDEEIERIIYRYSDYLYVQEIRISYETYRLFVMLNGACPKLFSDRECNILKIYDISDRTLLETIEMKPGNNQFDEVNLN